MMGTPKFDALPLWQQQKILKQKRESMAKRAMIKTPQWWHKVPWRNKKTVKKYQKLYYEKSKEKVKEYQRLYRENNKETGKKYKKLYLEKNKETVEKYKKLYREKNKEKVKEYRQLYREKNREKLLEYQRCYARLHYEKNKKKQEGAKQNAAAMDVSPQLDGVGCRGGSTPIAESSTFWDWPQRRMKSFDTRRRRWRRRSKKHRRRMESFDTRRRRWYRSRGRLL